MQSHAISSKLGSYNSFYFIIFMAAVFFLKVNMQRTQTNLICVASETVFMNKYFLIRNQFEQDLQTEYQSLLTLVNTNIAVKRWARVRGFAGRAPISHAKSPRKLKKLPLSCKMCKKQKQKKILEICKRQQKQGKGKLEFFCTESLFD